MFRVKIVFLAFFLSFSMLHQAQTRMSKKEKKNMIESLKDVLTSKYVYPEKAKKINTSLDSLYSTGKYKKIRDYKAFADSLTNDLMAISKDKHFKLQYRPDLVEPREQEKETENNEAPDEPKERIDLNLWYAEKTNFGFKKVEVLGGNIGYIKLTFFDPLNWAKPKIDAAMSFVANTDALIIDLRGNGGGYNSATYLASYFFDKEPMLWSTSFNRATNQTEKAYTYQKVDGKRYLDKSVYILVNEESFSRAEGFAYRMKHFKRATILGQTTAGAAHFIDFLEMAHSFFIQIPVGRNINPVTKTDWEGVGVIPHFKTQKGESLKVAHTKILDELIASKKDIQLGRHYDRLKERYKKIKTKINK